MRSTRIEFWLNERRIQVEQDLPGTTTLLRYLRDVLHLPGTKEGCAEGDCGACTVIIREEGSFRAVDSCLLFLPMVHGRHVFTVEGLRDRTHAGQDSTAGFHPVQQALVETRGSQCGYCTPGIVLSLVEACYREDLAGVADRHGLGETTEADVRRVDEQLAGNLCRCTGYRPIREAGLRVAGSRPRDRLHEVLDGPADAPQAGVFEGGGQRYLQPGSLTELVATRAAFPDAVLVAGGTDVGLGVTKRHLHPPVLLGLEAVPELRTLRREGSAWQVGAGVSLTRLQDEVGPSLPALGKMLRFFGSRQIRNRGTVGGNLCNASPIGDLAPVLLALDATLVAVGPAGEREIPVASFFEGYRRTALRSDEVLLRVVLPDPAPATFVTSYKVAKRRELDISAVSAGMALGLEGDRVVHVRLAFGGVAATPLRATATEHTLLGQPWSSESLSRALSALDAELHPISDHRGSAPWRRLVARNLLRGFFLESFRASRALSERPVATVEPLEVR